MRFIQEESLGCLKKMMGKKDILKIGVGTMWVQRIVFEINEEFYGRRVKLDFEDIGLIYEKLYIRVFCIILFINWICIYEIES